MAGFLKRMFGGEDEPPKTVLAPVMDDSDYDTRYYLQVTYDENDKVIGREYVGFEEGYELIKDEAAIKVDPEQLEQISAGKTTVQQLWEQTREPEEEAAPAERPKRKTAPVQAAEADDFVEKRQKRHPFSSAAQNKERDEEIEKMVGGGNHL